MPQQSRQLLWPDCYNVRDLGGLATVDGKTTHFGRIVRSDIPARLTDEGRQLMWDYGVRTILDLRTPWQIVEEPSHTSQQSDAPRFPTYINISIETYKPEVSAEVSDAGSREAVYCVVLDHYPKQIKLIMEAIATARDGAVLLHCHAGKDRTGMVSALLLGLVGVDRSVICHDYAQSQICLWPLWEKIVKEAGGLENADKFLKPDATEKVMHSVLDHLQSNYGGILPYLQSAGLSDSTLDALRQKLLGD